MFDRGINTPLRVKYCVKSVRIQRFSGPYFPTFGLNKERHRVPLRVQNECGKIRTRKTPNMDTFHAVKVEGALLVRDLKDGMEISCWRYLGYKKNTSTDFVFCCTDCNLA